MINERKKKLLAEERAAELAKKSTDPFLSSQLSLQTSQQIQRRTVVNMNSFYQPPTLRTIESNSSNGTSQISHFPFNGNNPHGNNGAFASVATQQGQASAKSGSKWRRFLRRLGCCYADSSDSEQMFLVNGQSESASVSNGVNRVNNNAAGDTTPHRKRSVNQSSNPQNYQNSYQRDWQNGAEFQHSQSNKLSGGVGAAGGGSNSRRSMFQTSAASFRNSITQMYDVLHYRSNGYSSLSLGHYSFFSIPVKFSHAIYSERQTYMDALGSEVLKSDFMLVVQTYFDSEFIAGIAKYASHTVCVYNTYLPSQINQQSQPPQQYGMGASGAAGAAGANGTCKNGPHHGYGGLFYDQMGNSSSQVPAHVSINTTKLLDPLMTRPDLSRADFIQCDNVPFTMPIDGYEKIVIVPVSLKEQRNSFDESLRMRMDFRDNFLSYVIEYATCLDRIVFVFPKYIKVREIMQVIHDAFSRVDAKLGELNLGVQVHAVLDDQNDVDVVAVSFCKAQHKETFAAISHRVFSNINPTLPSLALPSKRMSVNLLGNAAAAVAANAGQQKKEKLLSPQEQFVVFEEEEEEEDGMSGTAAEKAAGGTGTGTAAAGGFKYSKQSQSPFFRVEYLMQLGMCSYWNLYRFLKELNSCYIIQSNVFQYRTHVLDSMLKFKVIQIEFVDTLIEHFEAIDEAKKAKNGSTKGVTEGFKASENNNSHNNKQGKNNEKKKPKMAGSSSANEILTFRMYYVSRSGNYTALKNKQASQGKEYKVQLFQVNEQLAGLGEDQQHTSLDLLPDQKSQQKKQNYEGNSQESTFEVSEKEKSPIVLEFEGDEEFDSKRQLNSGEIRGKGEEEEAKVAGNEVKGEQASGKGIAVDSNADMVSRSRGKTRDKQISLNYYTSSTANKHVGFKSKLKDFQEENVFVGGDILDHTTASRIVDTFDKNQTAEMRKRQLLELKAKNIDIESLQDQVTLNHARKSRLRKYSQH